MPTACIAEAGALACICRVHERGTAADVGQALSGVIRAAGMWRWGGSEAAGAHSTGHARVLQLQSIARCTVEQTGESTTVNYPCIHAPASTPCNKAAIAARANRHRGFGTDT